MTTKWEYDVVAVANALAPGQLMVNTLKEFLTTKGQEGWELVTLAPGSHLGFTQVDVGGGQLVPVPSAVAVFKREADGQTTFAY